MDLERMSYIFGSFARRRLITQEVSSKRKSMEKISHDRSKSTPQTAKKITLNTDRPRAKSVCNPDECELLNKCSVCLKEFVEPKVLPCLHTFCLKCLEELLEKWQNSDGQSEGSDNASPKDSGGSGYISDKTDTNKCLTCPTCGTKTEIHPDGIDKFPPNYLVLNRTALTQISDDSRLLCDLCLSDISALSRCMECSLNFCKQCEDTHVRRKNPSCHQILTLEEVRKKGMAMRMRKQISCSQHRNQELCIFCYTCYEVICKDCWFSCHKSHKCEPITRAVKAHLVKIRTASEKAQDIAEQMAENMKTLQMNYAKVETHCDKMQTEVDRFIANYQKSLELHKIHLREQIVQARELQLEEITRRKVYLDRKLKEARDVACFVEELFSEGSDVEVMCFLKPVLERVRKCARVEKWDCVIEDSLQFFPQEAATDLETPCPIYGVVTSQIVSPPHCLLLTEGMNNLRVGKKTSLTLETRDTRQIRMKRGGEEVSAEVRYRDGSNSKLSKLPVEDRKDGTYVICFKPQTPGKLILNITVKGQAIQNSPFPVTVRTLRPHHGTFHCCSFCSSGGSKEASCGCGGQMPGGYKGCGHGHGGHPGRRHWSCCGNTREHSECARFNSHYQFTL